MKRLLLTLLSFCILLPLPGPATLDGAPKQGGNANSKKKKTPAQKKKEEEQRKKARERAEAERKRREAEIAARKYRLQVISDSVVAIQKIARGMTARDALLRTPAVRSA